MADPPTGRRLNARNAIREKQAMLSRFLSRSRSVSDDSAFSSCTSSSTVGSSTRGNSNLPRTMTTTEANTIKNRNGNGRPQQPQQTTARPVRLLPRAGRPILPQAAHHASNVPSPSIHSFDSHTLPSTTLARLNDVNSLSVEPMSTLRDTVNLSMEFPSDYATGHQVSTIPAANLSRHHPTPKNTIQTNLDTHTIIAGERASASQMSSHAPIPYFEMDDRNHLNTRRPRSQKARRRMSHQLSASINSASSNEGPSPAFATIRDQKTMSTTLDFRPDKSKSSIHSDPTRNNDHTSTFPGTHNNTTMLTASILDSTTKQQEYCDYNIKLNSLMGKNRPRATQLPDAKAEEEYRQLRAQNMALSNERRDLEGVLNRLRADINKISAQYKNEQVEQSHDILALKNQLSDRELQYARNAIMAGAYKDSNSKVSFRWSNRIEAGGEKPSRQTLLTYLRQSESLVATLNISLRNDTLSLDNLMVEIEDRARKDTTTIHDLENRVMELKRKKSKRRAKTLLHW